MKVKVLNQTIKSRFKTPLLIASSVVAGKFAEEISMKLCYNPSNQISKHYQKMLEVQAGSSEEDYCYTCSALRDY